ncbi:MAG: ABC transporter ATP-binding protein [Allobaculum sp.]
MPLLEVRNLQKIYKSRFSSVQVEALHDVSFQVEPSEFVAIMGESGSGKSTLLNLLAVLDQPTAGKIYINGQDSATIPNKELSAFRRNHLGFIFQDYSLLDTFTLKDNILLPLVLNKMKYPEMAKQLMPLARELSIEPLLLKYPYEVSGGQKQRCAAARALITHPDLLLADEPTGALDSKSSQSLLELFEFLNSQQHQTIVMVTHSVSAASYAKRVLFIKDGKIFHQLYRADQSREQFYEQISHTLTLMASMEENSWKAPYTSA